MNIVLLLTLTTWLGINEGIIVKYPINTKIESHSHLKQMYGGNEVYALYNRKSSIIYLSNLINLHSYSGKSILLHEIVHHYQNKSGLMQSYDCLAQSEELAYNIQKRYLLFYNQPLMAELDDFNIKMRSICLNLI